MAHCMIYYAIWRTVSLICYMAHYIFNMFTMAHFIFDILYGTLTVSSICYMAHYIYDVLYGTLYL